MNQSKSGASRNARIGQRLRLARINLDISHLDLCDELDRDCQCQELDDYESGRVIIPAIHLDQLARTLGMPVEFFLHDQPLLDWAGEWQLLRAFRSMSLESQRHLMRLVLDVVAGKAVSDHPCA